MLYNIYKNLIRISKKVPRISKIPRSFLEILFMLRGKYEL